MLVQASPGGLSLRITSPATEYILGEPINFAVTWKNESDKPVGVAYGFQCDTPVTHVHVEGPVRQGCAERPNWDIIPGAQKLGPMQEKASGFPKEFVGIVDKGDYEVWVEYDTRSLDASWTQFEVFPTFVESNHFKFKISAPTGLDATVFEKHAIDCNKVGLSPDDLLSRYPASTYTGYVLITRSVPLGGEPFASMENPEQIYKERWSGRASTQQSIQGHVKDNTEKMIAYAKSADLFLAAHPDFRYAPLIRRQYALCLGFTGRMPEAIEQVKVLAKGEGKEADEAKAYLAAKGEKAEKPQSGSSSKKN